MEVHVHAYAETQICGVTFTFNNYRYSTSECWISGPGYPKADNG